jgi:NMD protein affecting ribosome stability and mRNA decay
MELDPHAVGLIVSTVGVAVLMALTGVQKSALEWRHRRRLCPSCGRDLRSGCACL